MGPGSCRRSATARRWPSCFSPSLLIGTNWLLYVYAINSGHILAGSLGYYLNPLANILLGRFILKERLTRLQWAAVAIAAGGIAVLAAGALGTLWISLTLCFSFATYGLLRKVIAVDSLAGLTVETLLLFPIALGWLLFGGAEGRPIPGTRRHGNRPADGGRDRFDGAPALLHRRRPAPGLLDRRHAPVHRPDAAVRAGGRGL